MAYEDLRGLAVMVGMPRTGSTSLHHHLRDHPGVAAPYRKETLYFSFLHSRGAKWFRELYHHARPGQLALDVSPDYFFDPECFARIHTFDHSARALLCVRDPPEWILSLYSQRAKTDLRIPSFPEFLQGYDLRVGGRTRRLVFTPDFVSRRVEAAQQAFGDRLLLWTFDRFRSDPLGVLREIESFLALSDHFDEATFQNVRLNASDRRNTRWFYALVNDERVIAVLHRFLPERTLARVRSSYYRWASRGGSKSSRPSAHSPEDRALAEERFGSDRGPLARLLRGASAAPDEESKAGPDRDQTPNETSK